MPLCSKVTLKYCIFYCVKMANSDVIRLTNFVPVQGLQLVEMQLDDSVPCMCSVALLSFVIFYAYLVEA